MNESSQKPSGLTLKLDLLPYYNYTLYQNNVPICYDCRLVVSSKPIYKAVVLRVEGEDIEPFSLELGELEPGEMRLGLNIRVREDLLLNLEQEEVRPIRIYIESAGELLWQTEHRLKIQPYDYWHGGLVMPELLSSFVRSNTSMLSRVSLKVAEKLGSWTGNDQLSEYQRRDPNHVRQQVAAVYEALRSEGIAYASVPPSFTDRGQRVRLAEEVLSEKLGNCLDLSLLFAACFEHIGLHPLLILLEGHVFVGCWLEEKNYPYAQGDDVTFLLKASSDGINELVLLETTAITSSPVVPFEEAVRMAERSLLTGEKTFQCFVDIFRSRLGHIYPLKSRRLEASRWVVENEGLTREEHQHEVHRLQRYELEFSEEAELSKQKVWERKLLDMSLRNNLLNVRIGKNILPLISFNINEWEDHLQTDGSFQILSNPSGKTPEIVKGDIYNSMQYEVELGRLILEEVKSQRLHAFISEQELEPALKHLHRSARTALEENGANSLFLTLGVMKWFETEQSIQARYAPILLFPIEIIRQRPSSGGGYSIRSRDEDVMLNVTLLEMLKQKFGVNINAQDLLIRDAQGVDVMAVLSAMKQLIKELKGWDILPEAMIGIFSFSKFVMWNDIHSHATELRTSPIIKGLMDGETPKAEALTEIDVPASDTALQPRDLLLPIDIDSSQLGAILDAGRGRSFVLHGPPGTGKSQTITNMIAYALSQGKRVLFVAEKMAALSVVQSRLERIGLGAFCLELHSNKSNKTHILGQLARPLELVDKANHGKSEEVSSTLYEQRLRLMNYVEALHHKRRTGYSLYEHINAYEALSSQGIESAGLMRYEELDATKLQTLEASLGELGLLYELVGSPQNHPLACLDTASKNSIIPQELQRLLEDYLPLLLEADAMRLKLAEMLGLEIPDSAEGLGWCASLCALLLSAPSECQGNDLKIHRNEAQLHQAWAEASKEAEAEEAVAEEIAQWYHKYSKGSSKPNDDLVREAWQEAEQAWFIPRFFKRRSILKAQRAELGNQLLSETQLAELIALSQRKQVHKEQAIRLTPEALRGYCSSSQRPIASVRERYAFSKNLFECLQELAELGGSSLERSIARLEPWGEVERKAQQSLLQQAELACTKLKEQADKLTPYVELCTPAGAFAQTLKTQLPQALEQWHQFRDWSRWCQERSELTAKGLGVFVEAFEASNQTPEQTYQELSAGMHRAWIERFITEDKNLATFSGLIFEQVIERYRSYVREFQELCKEELQARLIKQLASSIEADAGAELTLLKRNISNKARGKAMRDVLLSMPKLLPRLAPCMLMSPISVAQYLSLEGDKFDLVIFDEASQMPTSEAVGAIARGHNLVVVGDPKQMPPTSFFANQQMEEELSDLDDMESILDDCISLSMPEHYLSWHYRSKHESLIAFSNAQYYQDKLYTFPSTDDLCSRVRLIPTEGVYDKGGSRSNKLEAQAVVDEIVRRLEDEELRKRSIGVVAFNQSQQNLIEDLLMARLAKHRELENYALQSEEPIFVKNLENVQGDERDVILFSVGYGPDKEGRVSMNFGPLNQQGGERRLNVAVSRARYEMLVFSAMKSEHIDLKRTNAKGVEGLKLFLEFAERGSLSGRTTKPQHEQAEVIKALAEALRGHGYEVHTEVGRSGFKIDLAVRDPKREGYYLLGILCDGQVYYQTQSTQDRELVRPTVLKLLGWEIRRLWSVDWYLNKQRVLEGILSDLERLQAR